MAEITSVEIIFISVVSIQIIYWLIWLVGIQRIKNTLIDKKEHGVSVLIAANNELANLKKLLPVIFNQTYNLFEVIIVNDRSTDGSREFLRENQAKYPELKVITVNELPLHLDAKKYAIILGIKSALYNQILLTDADCLPNSVNWIASFAGLWNTKTSFVVGFSQYEKKPGLLNYFIRFETILTGINYMASASYNRAYMGVGRNLSYSKELFLSKKGFHGFQDLIGGDDDIFVNKYASSTNTKLLLSPESTTTSIPKTKLLDFVLQKTRHLSVGKHYSIKSKFILAVFTLSWIFTWILLPFEIESTKTLLLPTVFMAARFFLMGLTYLIFTKKSGAKLNILGILLLDFMFVLYYFVTATRTLLTKQVKWS